MIPKIIHYCWFGRKEKPNNIIDNIRNWQQNSRLTFFTAVACLALLFRL